MGKAKSPAPEEWYPMKLGSSCHDDAKSRFYSLRYEFKPASIDSNRPGTMHNSVENKVTVEFFNNQAGKGKVGFQGLSEDCKELDAVLFFDGTSFRLERMYRAVKTLRHIRQPGESSAAAQGMNLKDDEPDDANGNIEKILTSQVAEKSLKKPPVAPQVQREKIESEEIIPAPTKPDPPAGKKKANKKVAAESKAKNKKATSLVAPASPVEKKRERESSPVNIDIDDEGDDESPTKKAAVEEEQIEVEELVEELSEYEEVDISEDEEDKAGVDQAAATLRAQAAAGAKEAKPSSSSSSSGSGSSGSGSSGSSSDTGSDDEDSASSADDGDDI